MKTKILLSAAAVAALALAGCGQKSGNTASTDTTNTTASADNTAGGGNTGGPGGPGQTKPVNDAQDAMAGPVGMASAETLGSHDSGAFVTNAAISDMYEIQAAKMAEQKSQSPAVKAFAKQMIKDHTATSTQLKGLVAKGGIKATIPTDLDQRRKGMLDNLTASQGKDFDTRYAAQQLAAHQEAVTLFTGFAKNGDNDALKAWAGQTAPKLQHHLDMAQQLKSSVGGGNGGGNSTGQ